MPGAHRDPHPGLEIVAEQFLELHQSRRAEPAARIGRGGRDFGLRRRRILASANRLLDRAHREVFGDDPPRELLLEGTIRCPEQRPRVTHANRAFLQAALDRRRELQEPQRVGDRHPALADARCHVVVGEREILDQLLIRARLLERIQLLALNVLDDRVLEHGRVVGNPDHRGHGLQTDAPRRAPPPLAGDELVATALSRADEDGLQDADLADRIGERAERFLVEMFARLLRVRPDLRDRYLGEAARLLRDRPGRYQGAETPTQPSGSRHGSPPWPARDMRERLARSNRTP